MELTQEKPAVAAHDIKLLMQRLIDSPQGLTLLTRGVHCRHEHWQHFKGVNDGAASSEYHEVETTSGDGRRFSIYFGRRRFTTADVDDLIAWASHAMKIGSGYANPKMLFVQN